MFQVIDVSLFQQIYNHISFRKGSTKLWFCSAEKAFLGTFHCILQQEARNGSHHEIR